MLFRLTTTIYILLICFLIGSGNAHLVNPTSFWAPAFLGLLYPFLLLLTLLFGLVWLLTKKKWMILFSFVGIGFTWSSFCDTFSFSAPAWTKQELSIITWNVKNFDLYNWSNNEWTRDSMMQLLEDEAPDILCMQEFYTQTKAPFKNITEIKKRLEYKYYFFGETYSIDNRYWGVITFSKYPIEETGQIFLEDELLNTCIYTDIDVDGEVIRIYNVHLKSNHFSYEDYSYLDDIAEAGPSVVNSKKIIQKMKVGYQKRAAQAIEIAEHISDYGGRHIVCGDFNDTPVSFSYRTLSAGMQDAFSKKGMGFGKTYINPTPFFRIDYVLADPSFAINRYQTIRKEYSDHYPIKVVFDWKEE